MKHTPFASKEQMKLHFTQARRTVADTSSAAHAWRCVRYFRACSAPLEGGRTFTRWLEREARQRFGQEPCLKLDTRAHRRPFKPVAPARAPFGVWRLPAVRTLRGYKATAFY